MKLEKTRGARFKKLRLQRILHVNNNQFLSGWSKRICFCGKKVSASWKVYFKMEIIKVRKVKDRNWVRTKHFDFVVRGKSVLRPAFFADKNNTNKNKNSFVCTKNSCRMHSGWQEMRSYSQLHHELVHKKAVLGGQRWRSFTLRGIVYCCTSRDRELWELDLDSWKGHNGWSNWAKHSAHFH